LLNEKMKGWYEKYKPEKLKEIIGQNIAINKLVSCFKEGKPVILHGNVGVGKTCSVYVLANENDCDVIEINASDLRNSEQINNVVGEALSHASLFGRGKIILVDEVDGIFGREDRGGVQALDKLIGNCSKKNFVVVTANDVWDKKLKNLRKKCEVVEFKKIGLVDMSCFLKNICEKEGVNADNDVVRSICVRSRGDIRAAISDLQVACFGRKDVSFEMIDVLGEREKENIIFEALRVVFKSGDMEKVFGIYDNLSENVNDIFLWLDENMHYEYSGLELEKGYGALSKANIFYSRITRWQHWRFLVYVYFLLSCGVALSKDSSRKGFTSYKRSMRPLKIWMNNQKNFKRKTIAEKLSSKLHTSKKEFIKEDLPYLKVMCRNNGLPDLGLSEEEIEWLGK